jgi:hypothetical protein
MAKASRPRAVPGELVVKVTPVARQDPERLQRIVRAISPASHVASAVDRFGMAVIRVSPVSDSSRVLEQLKADAAIEFIEPSYIDSAS